jgi:hypothetical protein
MNHNASAIGVGGFGEEPGRRRGGAACRAAEYLPVYGDSSTRSAQTLAGSNFEERG